MLKLDEAQDIAGAALAFLAADMARIERFLTVTGIGPLQIRGQAHTTAFQAGVLRHLLDDESMLLVFATENAIAPGKIAKAAHVLTAQSAQ